MDFFKVPFIRKNYAKRTAALSVIWLSAFTAFYFNGTQFLEMTLVFIVGWFFSLLVLNKPKKNEP
ncbi:MAG: hypothetical protein COT90_05225 [Candidatus Diapherotrites archaeon CG10_big_fil_rev_8_21_14_0_10_31_34]|nr:MAG: hypothetical protein COT90_05225 [Candidatus Diapherotrites archaeon CG10_big_fil_rev_8_21_14_0_10_31_34]